MTQFKTFPLMLLIGLISLCSCDSCSDEIDTTVLPPETQSGENTFGCYVNDELFVNSSKNVYLGQPSARGEYTRSINLLELYAITKDLKTIRLSILNPQVHSANVIWEASYSEENTKSDCRYFGGKNTGQVIIAKFDTINQIVSGQFKFLGRCSNEHLEPTGDSIMYFTQGRFDLRLYLFQGS